MGIINKDAASVYRYMNFDQIEEYADTAKAVTSEAELRAQRPASAGHVWHLAARRRGTGHACGVTVPRLRASAIRGTIRVSH